MVLYLLVAITPLLLVCCGNSKRLPKRKEGDTCNLYSKECGLNSYCEKNINKNKTTNFC